MSPKYSLLPCFLALVFLTTSAVADLPQRKELGENVWQDRIHELSGTNPEKVHQPAMAFATQLGGTHKASCQPGTCRDPSTPMQNEKELISSMASASKISQTAGTRVHPCRPGTCPDPNTSSMQNEKDLLSSITPAIKLSQAAGTRVHPSQPVGTHNASCQPDTCRDLNTPLTQNEKDLRSSMASAIKLSQVEGRRVHPVDPKETHQLNCPSCDRCVLKCRCKLKC